MLPPTLADLALNMTKARRARTLIVVLGAFLSLFSVMIYGFADANTVAPGTFKHVSPQLVQILSIAFFVTAIIIGGTCSRILGIKRKGGQPGRGDRIMTTPARRTPASKHKRGPWYLTWTWLIASLVVSSGAYIGTLVPSFLGNSNHPSNLTARPTPTTTSTVSVVPVSVSGGVEILAARITEESPFVLNFAPSNTLTILKAANAIIAPGDMGIALVSISTTSVSVTVGNNFNLAFIGARSTPASQSHAARHCKQSHWPPKAFHCVLAKVSALAL